MSPHPRIRARSSLRLRLFCSVALLLNASCDNGNNPVATTSPERQRVGRVMIATPGRNLTLGRSYTLTATVESVEGNFLTDRPMNWTVSHPALASITQAGYAATVRTQATGDLQVTASVEGVSGTLNFTISPLLPTTSPAAPPPTLLQR